jgi:hypothetical protein
MTMTDIQTVLLSLADRFERDAKLERESFDRWRATAENELVCGKTSDARLSINFAEKTISRYETYKQVAQIIRDKAGPV